MLVLSKLHLGNCVQTYIHLYVCIVGNTEPLFPGASLRTLKPIHLRLTPGKLKIKK